MLVQIHTLPAIVQEYIQKGESIELITNGQVIGKFVATAPQSPSYAKGDFSFDLQRMKKAVEAPYVVAPDFKSDEDFFSWLDGLKDEDFIAEKV
ncbi:MULTISPECIES: hypothetical protein [unclassified Moraxella]|uniref:hypothetical protein n=1 Tax=unclassified Moraxella TaxID=2685852 RepID=UPI003AF54D73